jgi:hypothetical protein
MDEIHPNELFTGHLYYLEYQNPKHFALGILELRKSLSFHVRLYHISESGKIKSQNFELFCKSCFLRG